MTRSICRADKHNGRNLSVLTNANSPGGVFVMHSALQPGGMMSQARAPWKQTAIAAYLFGPQGRLPAVTRAGCVGTSALSTCCPRVQSSVAFLQKRERRGPRKAPPSPARSPLLVYRILHSPESSLLSVRVELVKKIVKLYFVKVKSLTGFMPQASRMPDIWLSSHIGNLSEFFYCRCQILTRKTNIWFDHSTVEHPVAC